LRTFRAGFHRETAGLDVLPGAATPLRSRHEADDRAVHARHGDRRNRLHAGVRDARLVGHPGAGVAAFRPRLFTGRKLEWPRLARRADGAARAPRLVRDARPT